MILEKHLTIREAKNEIKHLENELDVYATQRNITYQHRFIFKLCI